MKRCEHGIYIPKGVFDGTSPSCSGCHPENAYILSSVRRHSLGVIMPERELDAADYMSQSAGARLSDTYQTEAT
jgi:hypothetical protein